MHLLPLHHSCSFDIMVVGLFSPQQSCCHPANPPLCEWTQCGGFIQNLFTDRQREAGTHGKVKEALMNGIERMELNKRRSAGGKGELTRNQQRPAIAVTD